MLESRVAAKRRSIDRVLVDSRQLVAVELAFSVLDVISRCTGTCACDMPDPAQPTAVVTNGTFDRLQVGLPTRVPHRPGEGRSADVVAGHRVRWG
jgi:hypothetical protein